MPRFDWSPVAVTYARRHADRRPLVFRGNCHSDTRVSNAPTPQRRNGWLPRTRSSNVRGLSNALRLLAWLFYLGARRFNIVFVFGFQQLGVQGFYPYIIMLKMTPVIVVAPIIILWMGQGLMSIVAITFLICFFPIVANTTLGLRSVDRDLVELFEVYGASSRQTMLWLRLPAALPFFTSGLKIAAALTPIGALYGDTIAGMGSSDEAGLGFLVVIFSAQFKIPALFASAFVACLIGFVFVGLVNLFAWRMLHKWHDSYEFLD